MNAKREKKLSDKSGHLDHLKGNVSTVEYQFIKTMT